MLYSTLTVARSSAVVVRVGVELNHTIVRVRDKRESAQFLAEILGLGDPRTFGPFLAAETGNNVSLDFADDRGPVNPQHYAFLVVLGRPG